MSAAGVITTVKHFPGLGRVRGNTDDTSGVTDGQTTSADPYLLPFTVGASAGASWLMVSSAIYTQIDAHTPAVFSPTIVQGLARDRLGFGGLIVSDDLGVAVQVAYLDPGARRPLPRRRRQCGPHRRPEHPRPDDRRRHERSHRSSLRRTSRHRGNAGGRRGCWPLVQREAEPY